MIRANDRFSMKSSVRTSGRVPRRCQTHLTVRARVYGPVYVK